MSSMLLESLESRQMLSADVGIGGGIADTGPIHYASDNPVVVKPVTPTKPSAPAAPAAPKSTGQWNLLGNFVGTYADTMNGIGADYHVVFTAQRHGVLHAMIRGNGDTFAATGTIDSTGKIQMVYRHSSHRYYFYGQIGQNGTRLSGTFSIRNGGVVTAFGSFVTHKAVAAAQR